MEESPNTLSDRLLAQSAEFQALSDQLSEVLKVKPSKWLEIRTGKASDTSAEREWAATPEGIAETVTKLKLKALEKSMSAIKTKLRVMSDESHNLY